MSSQRPFGVHSEGVEQHIAFFIERDLRLPVFRPNAERMTGGRNIHI